MRRRRRDVDGVPTSLVTFEEADWPGSTVEDRFRFWKAARFMWHEEHGWPGGPVELVRCQREVRRQLARSGRS